MREIQSIILNNCENTKPLYYKGELYSDFDIANKGLIINNKGSLTFDTYFNSFPIKKWRKYTEIRNLGLRLITKGRIKVTVVGCELINNNTIKDHVISSYVFDDDTNKERHIKIDLQQNDDIIYFKIFGLGDYSALYEAGYESNIDVFFNHNTRIALGICTYKREEYVIKNLDALKKRLFCNLDKQKRKFKVFVSDNGNTLPTELSNDDIQIFPNKNMGGSSGFARCMLESFFSKNRKEDFSHIVLMDDDIWFEPEMFIRLYEFIGSLKQEYFNSMIAFSMFFIESPCIQYTKGKIREKNKSNCLKHNLDLSFLKNVLINDKDNVEANYSGWWCHCIPESYIQSDNLPFPFFIRCDDTEYGCRYKNHIITLNGLGVWHPSFDGKHPISMNYYDKRNQLIFMTEDINAISKDYVLYELWMSYKNALYMDYDKALVEMKGIEDFVNGPYKYELLDSESNHKSICAFNRKYVDPPLKEKAKLNYICHVIKKTPNVERLFLYAILPGIINKYINYDVKNTSLLFVRKLYCYNSGNNKGFYLKKSLGKALVCWIKYIRLRNYIEKNYNKIVEEWKGNIRKLCSLNSWVDRLGLSIDDYIDRNEALSVSAYKSQNYLCKIDNLAIRIIKHIIPWYTILGVKLRRYFVTPPHFTVRSDYRMYFIFCFRKFLSRIGLSWLNPNMKKIRKLKNIHKGERCFITCTGPSLQISDLELLKDEYTFGVNSIIKAYKYTDWRPTFYALIDLFAYGNSIEDIRSSGLEICKDKSFFHYGVSHYDERENEYFIPISYTNHWKHRMENGIVKINHDLSAGLYDCFTVTNMAISIAAYMGFKKIYIIGADSTYKLEKTHFIEGEWEKKHKNAQADLEVAVLRSMMAYERINNYYKKRGIEIYNATRGGMLEVFPRVDFDALMAER